MCVSVFLCDSGGFYFIFFLVFFRVFSVFVFLASACHITCATGTPLPVIYIFVSSLLRLGSARVRISYLCVSGCLSCWCRMTKKEQRRRERKRLVVSCASICFCVLCAFTSDHCRRRRHHQRITARRWRGEKKESVPNTVVILFSATRYTFTSAPCRVFAWGWLGGIHSLREDAWVRDCTGF